MKNRRGFLTEMPNSMDVLAGVLVEGKGVCWKGGGWGRGVCRVQLCLRSQVTKVRQDSVACWGVSGRTPSLQDKAFDFFLFFAGLQSGGVLPFAGSPSGLVHGVGAPPIKLPRLCPSAGPLPLRHPNDPLPS